MNIWHIVFALLMGFSLAATCGLRAFLPLLIIGIGAKAGLITLTQSFDWMQSWPALICFGSATVIEIVGDKFPAVDHFLDTIGIVVRPVAGALAATSLIQGLDPLTTLVIGIIMGSAIAGVTHTIKASARLASTALTAGITNPLLSVLEDIAVFFTGALSLWLPWIAAIVIIVTLIIAGRLIIRRKKSKDREV
jgi:hypothetical protein